MSISLSPPQLLPAPGGGSPEGWRPFESARAFARALGLTRYADWIAHTKGEREGPPLPDDIPKIPATVYRNSGWAGYADWIGKPNARRPRRVMTYRVVERTKWAPYAEASALAKRRRIKSSAEWKKFAAGKRPVKGRCPSNIPSNPQIVYPEWNNWGEFLGTGNRGPSLRSRDRAMPFWDARIHARSLKLQTTQWIAYVDGEMSKKGAVPPGLPRHPNAIYRGAGWCGWRDFLGLEVRVFVSYDEARAIVQRVGIRTMREFCQRRTLNTPADLRLIPSDPKNHYASDWKGYTHFLGLRTTDGQ